MYAPWAFYTGIWALYNPKLHIWPLIGLPDLAGDLLALALAVLNTFEYCVQDHQIKAMIAQHVRFGGCGVCFRCDWGFLFCLCFRAVWNLKLADRTDDRRQEVILGRHRCFVWLVGIQNSPG